jgi:hypothetical protein
VRTAFLALAAAVLLTGCGRDDSTTDTTTTTTPVETSIARVYFLRDGKVWPAAREVPETGELEPILEELVAGPSDAEQELGFTSALPGGFDVPEIGVADGVATLEVPEDLSDEALAQLVYTITQVDPVVTSVDIGDRSVTRADFEDLTPAILVESPLAFQEVGNPVQALGTANTFEATFEYELTDTDGKIVDEDFVTATSGTGTRGTFDFTTKSYRVPFDGVGALIVFERSAKDGSRINLVEIPVRMTR